MEGRGRDGRGEEGREEEGREDEGRSEVRQREARKGERPRNLISGFQSQLRLVCRLKTLESKGKSGTT